MSRNQKIREQAIEIGEISGYEYWIVPAPIEGLNGYVMFPKKPVRESGHNGILSYIPVHGGITYAEHDNTGSVYGFDTSHCDSKEFPRYEKSWIKSQCEIMLKGILRAAEVESKYLRCISNKGKAKYCDYVRSIAPDTELGMGAMLNLLSGKL